MTKFPHPHLPLRIATAWGLLFISTWIAPALFAQGYSLTVEEHAIDGISGQTTYRMYIDVTSATDFVSACTGAPGAPLGVSTTTSFYNNQYGGELAGDINAMFFTLIPDVQYDSWVTIGIQSQHIAPEVGVLIAQDPDSPWTTPLAWSQFDNDGILLIDDATGGAWLVQPGVPNGLPDPTTMRVLIAQFTTDGNLQGTINALLLLDGNEDANVTYTFHFNGPGTYPPSDQPGLSGCLDPLADNYDAAATISNGSCTYLAVAGCTDESACNYDALATADDGSCAYPDLYFDCENECLNDADGDGTCDELEIPGCTDPSADNYNPEATDDNASCEYPLTLVSGAQDAFFDCSEAADGLASWLATAGGAAVSGGCGGIMWSHDYGGINGGCGDAFVTFFASDACGNSVSTYAMLTLDDATPPTIVTPASDLDAPCDSDGIGLELWLSSHGGAEATDACGDVMWSHDFSGFDGACSTTVTVTFTATDACGNSATTAATYANEDVTPPTIVTSAVDFETSCGDGNALEVWLASRGGATATDNCGDITWSNDFSSLSGACSDGGSATVTFTATDGCGNSASTTATFSNEDVTPPTIVTPAADLDAPCDGNGIGLELWLADHGGAEATDDCEDIIWSHDFSGFEGACSTSVTVTFTATDACGNSASTSATYSNEDVTPPTIVTSATDFDAPCADGNALEVWLASRGGATATDNCGSVTWSNDFSGLSGACNNGGFAIVTFTATDACGNSASTTAMFSNEDVTPPTIVTPAADLDAPCDTNAGELETWLANHGGATATDNCGNVTWTHDFPAYNGPCNTTATVTFTAIDACGNSASTTATYSNEDVTPPAIVTSAVDLDATCADVGALEVWLLSNGGATATDNCAGITWSNDFAGLTDNGAGQNTATVTFTASDACGNTATTSATFSSFCENAGCTDVTACNYNEEANTNDGSCVYAETYYDCDQACINDGDGDGVCDELEIPGCMDSDADNFNPEATDDNGSCVYPLVIANHAQDATFNCETAAEGIANWLVDFGGAEVSGGCGDVTWENDYSGSIGNCSLVVVTFTATDACGNTASTSALLTVNSTSPPSIVQEAMNVTALCGDDLALQNWLETAGGATATALCGGGISWQNNFTGLHDDCGNNGFATVTFTATDGCGNQASTTATFTSVDTTPPTIVTPATNLELACNTDGTEFEAWLASHGGATAEDACGEVTWSHDLSDDYEACGTTATVTFTATDDCGNSAHTTATFSNEDTTAPLILTGAQSMSVTCENAGALEEWLATHGGASAIDNCDSIAWSHDFTELLENGMGGTAATVTFTASDACGNTATTVATFTNLCTNAGCTDPLACNYDANASVEDGSCDYCSCQDALYDENYTLTVETQAVNGIPGLTTYRIYVNMLAETDFLSAVFGDQIDPLTFQTQNGFYNNPNTSGSTADGLNPLFYSIFPEMAYDSWVTIGNESAPTPPATGITLGESQFQPWIGAFNANSPLSGQNFEMSNFDGGSWFVVNGASNGLPDPVNLRVLIMQVTADSAPFGQLNVQVFPNGSGLNQERYTFAFDGLGTFLPTSVTVNACGCTDETAINFDADADYDNGTCDYTVFGCTDAGACNFEADATDEDGSCTYAQANLDCNGNCLNDADGDGVCDEFEVPGCDDPTACNYEEEATDNDGSCLEFDACGVCGGSSVPGCMSPSACNFDPNAGCSDLSLCDWDSCAGCTDASACNFDPNAEATDLSSCTYPIAEWFDCDGNCLEGNADDPGSPCASDAYSGCTDPDADNYDAVAASDNGSCYYTGCMLPEACNFDPDANNPDNAACAFAEPGYDCNGDCIDANQNGVCDFEDTCVVGCMLPNACNFNPLATLSSDYCLFYDECAVCGGGGIPAGACNCAGDAPEFGYDCEGTCILDADGDGVCDLDEITGCEDASACNYAPEATEPGYCAYPDAGYDCADNCLNDADGDGICDEFEVAGCTEPLACNFAAGATDDDGSCTFAESGYTCEGNCLFDADGDGVCDQWEVVGCLDPTACNFNGDATESGACIYPQQDQDCDGACINDSDGDGVCDEDELVGCSDSTAINYVPYATDEGPCLYEFDFANPCPLDLSGDGGINTADLLLLLGGMGYSCDEFNGN